MERAEKNPTPFHVSHGHNSNNICDGWMENEEFHPLTNVFRRDLVGGDGLNPPVIFNPPRFYILSPQVVD